MSQPILDVSNPNYWEAAYEVTLTAAASSVPTHHTPIPQHQIPITFDRHTLLVGASSFRVRPTWRLGFWLSMIVSAAGVGSAVATQRAIPLGLTLVRFPLLSPDFKLKANIPKWHEEMSMKFWKYIGPESDVLNLLQNFSLDLTQIETKIDQL